MVTIQGLRASSLISFIAFLHATFFGKLTAIIDHLSSLGRSRITGALCKVFS